MQIHAIEHGSRVNGPGLRSVIFVQGCALACPGCHNPLTWDFTGGTLWTEPDALARHVIENAAPGTTGITLSGGEPMAQAQSTALLAWSIHRLKPEWDIGMFTGHTIDELKTGRYASLDTTSSIRRRTLWRNYIRRYLSWAIMGRYERDNPPENLPESTPWRHAVSSANQRLWLFDRKFRYSDFPPLAAEFSIDEGGLVSITGYLPKATGESHADSH